MVDRAGAAPAVGAKRAGTARSVAWNYFGYAFQIGVNFGLSAYVVRRVSMAEYGIFLFALSLSSTLYLLDLGLSSVMVQEYVDALLKPGIDHLERLFGSLFAASAAFGFIGAVALLILAAMVPGPFHIPLQFGHEAAVVLVFAAGIVQVNFLNLAIEPLYHAANRFDRLNQIQVGVTALLLTGTVVLLQLGFGIIVLAGLQLVSQVLQFLLMLAFLPSIVHALDFTKMRFCPETLRAILKLSRWAFLNNITSYLLEGLVWLILASVASMHEAALYGIATKMPRQLWNLVDRGGSVNMPLLSQHFAKGDRTQLRRTFLQSQRLIFGGVLPFIVLGCIFARPIIRIWAGSQYEPAAPILQWLLIATLSQAVLYSSDQLLYAIRQVKRAAFISAAGSIATIACAIVLTPRLGGSGIALSMAVCQFIFGFIWFTAEACRYTGSNFRELGREGLRGLGLPSAALVLGILLIEGISRHLPPFAEFAAATGVGGIYLALWGTRTALPLYRRQLEAKD